MPKLYILDKPFKQEKNIFFFYNEIVFSWSWKTNVKEVIFLFLNNLVGGGEKMSNEKEMSFVQQY